MGRNILFITTDQQRYDSLGCNGGTIAKTPVADRLAASGINYRRAHNQNVVCMPARSTMITGQYVRTHGVFANGVALPPDSPSVATYLHGKGYRTALLGKAHFEPAFDMQGRWFENRMAREDSTGPYRGFERMELAMHVPIGGWHYSLWLQKNHPDEMTGFAPILSALAGGDTGAPEVKYNPIPREHYHTDWVADRTIAFLNSLDPKENWFVWMSFPDPHHPWDPPESEARRINWRDLDLPDGYPGSREKIEKILAQKPRHWLDWYEGRFWNFEGGPGTFIPGTMTENQLREVNAMIHVENELIDQACGRVLVANRGARMGIEHRRDLHHRSRRAARRLRPALQGPVSRRRADAPADDLAAGAVGKSRRPPKLRSRSDSSISRRHFARSRACRFPTGCRASRCRPRRARAASA